jgi:hypothetical protein
MPSSSYSLVIAIELKAKYSFDTTAIVALHSLVKGGLVKVVYF